MTVRDFGTTAPSGRLRVGATRASAEIDLIFVPDVPADERWLWDNPDALRMALQGAAEARRGRASYVGSFAQYADLDIDD